MPVDKIDEADVLITSASSAIAADGEEDAGPTAAILLLSDVPRDAGWLNRSNRIWGIIPLDSSSDELRAAIHALSQGLIVGEPSLMFHREDDASANSPLTERETEVLNLLSNGLANKQIAAKLGISEHTVKFHVSSIYQKLNVSNRTEAVREGLRGGWIAL